MKKAANKKGGDRIWRTDLKFGHLNETARFIQNDAVSYIYKKKKRKQNGVVLNDTVHLLPPPGLAATETKNLKIFPRLSPRPHHHHRKNRPAMRD